MTMDRRLARLKQREAILKAVKSIREQYGLTDEDLHRPGIYSFDRVTMRPIVKPPKKR
jgi:hypothetical protein